MRCGLHCAGTTSLSTRAMHCVGFWTDEWGFNSGRITSVWFCGFFFAHIASRHLAGAIHIFDSAQTRCIQPGTLIHMARRFLLQASSVARDSMHGGW